MKQLYIIVEDIAELTGMSVILEKCPRFKSWVERVAAAVIGS